jgi:hypothetical protein
VIICQDFGAELKHALRKALQGWGELDFDRMARELTALGTKPGAPPQHRHTDWDIVQLKDLTSRARPVMVIVALISGSVWVWPRDTSDDRARRDCICTEDGNVTCPFPEGATCVPLKAGDALLLTADTMHAGGKGEADQGGETWFRIAGQIYPVGYTQEGTSTRPYFC